MPESWCEIYDSDIWWCPAAAFISYQHAPVDFDHAFDKWDEKAKVELQLELVEVKIFLNINELQKSKIMTSKLIRSSAA